MSLKDRIALDMKDAMRARETGRLEAIRMLRAAIQRREVDERVELNDDDVAAVIAKLVKQGRDAAQQFRDGGRPELAAKELQSVALYESYLPEQLSGDEIDAAIAEAIECTGASSPREMGKVMGVLRGTLQGRADLGAVSARVKSRLTAGN